MEITKISQWNLDKTRKHTGGRSERLQSKKDNPPFVDTKRVGKRHPKRCIINKKKEMCLYPKKIKNPKYLPNKKNNNNPPEITDERVKYVPVGCGNCMECRKQKKREWETDRKSTRLNSSHITRSRMPSSA